jgi:uncharacterized protein (TIGR00369 family)
MEQEAARATFSADLAQRLNERFQNSPTQRFARFAITRLALDEADLQLEFRPEFDNGNDSIHGGILAMLADSAVACALSTNFDGRMGFATSNLNIHFLRRAQTRVTARARIVKKGGTVCVGSVEISDDDQNLVATCTCDFILTSLRGTLSSR